MHCQVFLEGTITARVVELRDDYTGTVHLRATKTSKPCDGDFFFRMQKIDASSRPQKYSELDSAGWEFVELRPVTP